MTSTVVSRTCTPMNDPIVRLPSVSKQWASRRRCRVGAAKRIFRIMLGCPNARRAWGAAQTGFLPCALRTHGPLSRHLLEHAQTTPVFMVDRRGSKNNERLPRIWLSEPNFDLHTGQTIGRVFVDVYPKGTDQNGMRALGLAERYLGEAYGYEVNCEEDTSLLRSDERQDRVGLRTACFQAAEILCLHAASRGNTQACVYLASLYRGDLCAGTYWKSSLEQRACHARSVDYQVRAFRLLKFAAARKNTEACLYLGDAFAEGVGCTANAPRAYTLYRYALTLSCIQGSSFKDIGCIEPASPDINDNLHAGQAALRIARCHEGGCGCAQDTARALLWYHFASECLKTALDEGFWRCKRSYIDANKGILRMKQEISGKY